MSVDAADVFFERLIERHSQLTRLYVVGECIEEKLNNGRILLTEGNENRSTPGINSPRATLD